jgi:hypothetical protein
MEAPHIKSFAQSRMQSSCSKLFDMPNFNNFQMLNPEAADLARELIHAPEGLRSDFGSFANAWMSFNGWMECVTEAANDAEMIAALVGHKRLSDTFDDLMERFPDFHAQVQAFAAMWPVINVRDARRKLGRDALWRFSRTELMEEVMRKGVKLQPVGWNDGSPPTWSQLLGTIYGVRCNLFHGAKSPQNSRDHSLVVACDKILRLFIEHSCCFDWHDA